MNTHRVERWCAWSGMLAVTLFFIGFAGAHFIPPLSPSLTPEQVVAHYQVHSLGIRAGMLLMMISGMFMAPMVGLISTYLRRIEGATPALAYGQIVAGTANAMFFFVPALLFIVTAYRPERNPELTYLMNDLSWIMAVLPWPPAFAANICIAVAIFCDRSAQPVFPRWLAYLNIWVSLAYVPGGLLPFFKSGPFGWNGLLVFWLAGTAFCVWFVAMTAMLLKAIDRAAGVKA